MSMYYFSGIIMTCFTAVLFVVWIATWRFNRYFSRGKEAKRLAPYALFFAWGSLMTWLLTR